MSESDLTLYGIAGFLGVAFYLGSYAALQLGYLNGQGYAYAGLNMVAASCVLISLFQAFNMSSALIQVFWIIISVVGIVRAYLLTLRIRFTDEEQDFLYEALPGLSKIKARKLLDLGFWITGETGAELTREQEPVPHLIYLASGTAEVKCGGKTIAICEAKTFIGELTAISGDLATATVVLNETSRYLAINVEALRARIKRDVETRACLESCVAGHMLSKLKMSNMALANHSVVAKA